jgi:rubrerythrin
MTVDFKNSETMKNLMKAFAGESQARNRYTFAQGQAKKENLYVISEVFCFTADQEKEHAEIFYQHLQKLSHGQVSICADYPVDTASDPSSLLRLAKEHELDEHAAIYPEFAKIAREEGFSQVAGSFELIAAIENTHAKRFEEFEKMVASGTLFSGDAPSGYVCLNCGHAVSGSSAPEKCPVCQHDKGFFVKTELAPFTK